jgi:hypothetical protein
LIGFYFIKKGVFMDFAVLLALLQTLAPWIHTVLVALGAIVTVGTVVDQMVPDTKDGGFMTKILAMSMVGPLLTSLARFSPFNIKEK